MKTTLPALPESATETGSRERRNFISATFYQIALRIGWIFKTESVMIPAALDSLGASGWVRGCLPMLNRLGQSLPPLLVWPAVKRAEKQKRWLAATTLMMGLLFCALSCLWLSGLHETGPAAQWTFLGLYGLFFVATGINQLTLSSLIGKLIRVDHRGRLMLAANTLGCVFSVSCAWFVLRHWLRENTADFAAIFGTSGILFVVAALTAFCLDEPATAPSPRTRYRVRSILSDVWQTFVEDRSFRLLATISGLFGLSMTLMPHYQNLARVRLDLGFSDLLPWLIIQNLGVAFFSVPAGAVADRLGNRAALRLVLSLLLAAPVAALLFSRLPGAGRQGFLLVYFLLGLMPVTMRILINYTLEFSVTENQPRYLAAQSLAMALPVVASSMLIGWLMDRFGYEAGFGLAIACMATGLVLTFRLHEPRNARPAT